jgi:exodeoxyribonuclease VII large subunit
LVWGFAPVQDRHAAPQIAAALRELAALHDVEIVIVARGGGSLADLFAFCDEALCRTVALLRVPVIASVGHHTDRTLIDDVGNSRGPRPRARPLPMPARRRPGE